MTHHQGKIVIKLGWPEGAAIRRDEKFISGVLEVANALSRSKGDGDLQVVSLTESHTQEGTFQKIVLSPSLRRIADKERPA